MFPNDKNVLSLESQCVQKQQSNAPNDIDQEFK